MGWYVGKNHLIADSVFEIKKKTRYSFNDGTETNRMFFFAYNILRSSLSTGP